MQANEVSNLSFQLEDSKKHLFGSTSEQRKLLNNHNFDKCAMDKSEYDSSDKKDNRNSTNGNETDSNTSSDSAPAQNKKPSRSKETAPRVGKTRLKVDKVVIHEMDEYYTFPEEARYEHNGMPEVENTRLQNLYGPIIWNMFTRWQG